MQAAVALADDLRNPGSLDARMTSATPALTRKWFYEGSKSILAGEAQHPSRVWVYSVLLNIRDVLKLLNTARCIYGWKKPRYHGSFNMFSSFTRRCRRRRRGRSRGPWLLSHRMLPTWVHPADRMMGQATREGGGGWLKTGVDGEISLTVAGTRRFSDNLVLLLIVQWNSAVYRLATDAHSSSSALLLLLITIDSLSILSVLCHLFNPNSIAVGKSEIETRFGGAQHLG